MTTELEQNNYRRLRTRSLEERRAFALKLAQSGTEGAVEELIRVVDGGDRRPAIYGRKHWYSLFPSCLRDESWEFGLDDQLVAVEALGETKSKRALEFLKEVAKFDHEADDPGDRWIGSDEIFYDRYLFPRARGALQSELNTVDEYGSVSRAATEDDFIPDNHVYEQLTNKRAYRMLQAAIGKLESTILNELSSA